MDERTRRLREQIAQWLDIADGLDRNFNEGQRAAASLYRECARQIAAVLDTEWDVSPWDSHGQIRWKGDASPVAPQGIAHEWRFDTIIGHYRCNRCLARDDGSHGPTCPEPILPDPPVQP